MLYDLSEQNQRNLAVFLSRVTLSGSEVAPFNELLVALNTPIIPKQNDKEEGTTSSATTPATDSSK